MSTGSVSSASSVSRFWAAFDGAGALASFLCLIHCVGIPILLAAFPGMTFGFVQAEAFHKVVAVIAAILAFGAFSKGFREHRAWHVIVLGMLGAILLFFAAWGPFAQLESKITIGGSVFLIFAHLENYRKIQSCGHAGHAHV